MIEPTRRHDAAYPWASPFDDCLRENGLTKRELFAVELFKTAVQAQLSCGDSLNSMRSTGLHLYAKFALECSDVLMAELNDGIDPD